MNIEPIHIALGVTGVFFAIGHIKNPKERLGIFNIIGLGAAAVTVWMLAERWL